jgi:uncharacterized protein
MDDRAHQQLHLQPGEYVIDHLPQSTVPPPGADWVALVRAPEGLTIVRRPTGTEAAFRDRWAGFYGGQTAHGLHLPGMLAAVVNPLAQAAIPVFVTSTYHADLVLVPVERLAEAGETLRQAGHVVHDTASGLQPG